MFARNNFVIIQFVYKIRGGNFTRTSISHNDLYGHGYYYFLRLKWFTCSRKFLPIRKHTKMWLVNDIYIFMGAHWLDEKQTLSRCNVNDLDAKSSEITYNPRESSCTIATATTDALRFPRYNSVDLYLIFPLIRSRYFETRLDFSTSTNYNQ